MESKSPLNAFKRNFFSGGRQHEHAIEGQGTRMHDCTLHAFTDLPWFGPLLGTVLWPWELSPQHRAPPSTIIAQVCSLPVETSATPPACSSIGTSVWFLFQ